MNHKLLLILQALWPCNVKYAIINEEPPRIKPDTNVHLL